MRRSPRLRRNESAVDEEEFLFSGRRSEEDGGGAFGAGAADGDDLAEPVFRVPNDHALLELIRRDGGLGRRRCERFFDHRRGRR